MGFIHDALQFGELGFIPSDHQRAAFHGGQVHLAGYLKVFAIPRLHAGKLDAIRWRVETRMHNRAVCFAGT